MTISASAGWVIGLKTKRKSNIFWAFFLVPSQNITKGGTILDLTLTTEERITLRCRRWRSLWRQWSWSPGIVLNKLFILGKSFRYGEVWGYRMEDSPMLHTQFSLSLSYMSVLLLSQLMNQRWYLINHRPCFIQIGWFPRLPFFSVVVVWGPIRDPTLHLVAMSL